MTPSMLFAGRVVLAVTAIAAALGVAVYEIAPCTSLSNCKPLPFDDVVSSVEIVATYFPEKQWGEERNRRGQTASIWGRIRDVRPTPAGDWVVVLVGVRGHDLECLMRDDQIDRIASLAVGQGVILRGTCKGVVAENIAVEDCAIDRETMSKRKDRWPTSNPAWEERVSEEHGRGDAK
jgi:hypothetical protein